MAELTPVTPTPTSSRVPSFTWGFSVGLIIIAIFAFIIGAKLAQKDLGLEVKPEPEPEVPGIAPELPDGKGEEEIVYGDPQPVPADIAAFAYPPSIPFHPDFAVQFEASFSPSDEMLYRSSAYSLGEVTVRGQKYTLEMHETQVEGLGTNYTTYYVLTSDQAYDLLLSDRLISNGAFGQVVGYSNIEDTWPLFTPGPTRIRFESGVRIPMLELRDISDKAAGEVYHSLGLSRRLSKEEILWLASASDCTRRTTSMPLCRVLPQGQRPMQPENQYTPVVNAASWRLRPDARLEWYVIDVPFRTDDAEVSSPFIPLIEWTDGGAKDLSYIQGHLGGCGVSAAVDVVEDTSLLGELREAGTYAVAGRSGTVYVASHIDETDWIYTFWKENNPQGTVEQFAATRPYFYWTDSIGRLLKFTSSNAVPPVECGKPVIYLYPEETTDLTVLVDPQGGFTYTDPEYGTGWNVTAHPDGHLVNKADGKTYPYLFWEGRGGLYQPPQKYWVVKQGEVHGFLIDTLAKLGLNTQETADFLEFWEPRMEAAPYYKIGFYGTDVMNQIAPLSISQKPDTLVRILMDYEELQNPVTANPPRLPKTPVRNGFTVIEWGGVLR